MKVVVDWKVAKDGSFKVVKDGIDHVAESDAAIVKTSLPRSLLVERRAGTSYISHNKFIVLIKNNEPQSVIERLIIFFKTILNNDLIGLDW